ncbi:MAG: hypothetical protein V1844_08060 [Pseudomonadota bacterium]
MALLNDPVNGIPKKQSEPGSPRECITSDCGTSAVKRLLPLYYEYFYSDPSERSSAFFSKAPAAFAFGYFSMQLSLGLDFLNANAGTAGGSHRFCRVLACQGEQEVSSAPRIKNCKIKLDLIAPVRYLIKPISAAEAV